MMNNFEKIKDEFIIDDLVEYWEDKMNYYKKIMQKWLEDGITVSVANNKVIAIYGADELCTEEKHEIASATEGFLYAEGQYECANDANATDSVTEEKS